MTRFAAALLTAATLAGLASAAPRTDPAQAPGPDLASAITLFREDAESFNNFNTMRWSDGKIANARAFLSARLKGLETLAFDALSQEGKVDYLLLRNHLRSKSAYNDLAERQLAEMDRVLTVRSIIIPLEEARWRMETCDPRTAAEQLARIPSLIKAAREGIDAGREAARQSKPPAPDAITLSPTVALRASRALDTFNGSLRTWFEYHDGFQPNFTWWCRKPHEEAARAISELAKFIREEVAGVRGKPEDPLIGDPIGRETLLADLKNEFIGLSPETLIEIGNAEFAWCEAQMRSAADAMGMGDDWKSAIERVKGDAMPPGEQTTYITTVAREAIAFMKDNNLVTIPPMCEEFWRLRMLSPEAQRTLPFAAYNEQSILVASPTSDMSHADKLMALRGNNRHFTRIVTPHELIPGHHLQLFVADRERPYRRLFSTPFFVEGWALYWEMKLWDLGWARTPEERVGMLFWRMHRCARIIVSLKFHLGEMTPAEMVDFLVDRVGHERANATAEVRRYIGGDYSPLYQCGYMIGGKQLRAMHTEAKVRGMAERDFNDAVLRCGSIPMELVRAQVLGTPLRRDKEAEWDFSTGR
ncbi:MAG: DUF885 domain-containing protein [Phycisphaerales bacterium]